ncbi:kinase-like domain-containing protein [Glomus cerebriforme]|uniref:Kinase-like domain-containing protein n=1 Tax=Glomus cerebriforme TaxID=658196 RepID=A0A397TIK4_9GLOM|nr:kinase-like domain-containing protein [Glomus cerebriforme]
MTLVKEKIEQKIEDRDIKYFEYGEFKSIKEIGIGAFGRVSRAYLASNKLEVALKSFINENSNIEEDTLNEFFKELNLLRKVSHDDNINSFLGITKNLSGNYVMVLEYANDGNLREYLKRKFTFLKWEDKIQMALDITGGLKCLHHEEIIHRDLHSKNILVNNGKLLIADLGLSKKLAEISSNSVANRLGMVEYTDPRCYTFTKFKKNKKTDIYGLGVLLWEITSGRPPFHDHPREEVDILGFHIRCNGLREKPVEGTPLKYQQLYQKCWDVDHDIRPDIEEVYEILSQLKTDLLKTENLSKPENSFYLQVPIDLHLNINADKQIELQKSNSYVNDSTLLDLSVPSSFGGDPNSKTKEFVNSEVIDATQIRKETPINDNLVDQIEKKFTKLNLEEGEKEKIRNLLIVGRTGSGKSTLANVLSDYEEFKESMCIEINETNNLQKINFEENGIKYCVVDTVGFKYSNLSMKVVLDKIKEGIYSIPEGISQILFVIDKPFAADEKEMIESFEKYIFESGIVEYITIVRTKFSNFMSKGECEKDKSQWCNENKSIAKIIESCGGVIHVNNPPIYISEYDFDDDDDKEGRIKINKKMRNWSRTTLLDHLKGVCEKKYYKLRDVSCSKTTIDEVKAMI